MIDFKGNSRYVAAAEIVRGLRAKGYAAYFAGGCVRDMLLGVEAKDFDVGQGRNCSAASFFSQQECSSHWLKPSNNQDTRLLRSLL